MKIAKFTIPLLGCIAALASTGCAPILAGGAMAGGVSVEPRFLGNLAEDRP